eukprot:gene23088-29914_t
MQTNSFSIIAAACLLSLLCFIPAAGVELNYNRVLLSSNVYISFLCAAVASLPMLLDCLWDVSCKLKWIRLESARDHSYLIERLIIFVGFTYPTMGYLTIFHTAPMQVGQYYTALSNSQTIWLGGAYLAIIHSSKSNIWTLQWCLCIVTCLVGSNVSSLFFPVGVIMQIIYYLFIVAAVTIFTYLYGKTIISVRNKANINKISIPSSDYFCLLYATLTFLNFIAQAVITSVMYNVYGDEVAIIYTNIAAIVCITLANMIPNRREEETKLKLESTEQSLAMKQAFVRYLSHE